MSTKYNAQSQPARKTFVPSPRLTMKEHRPIRWLVRQFFDEKEEDGHVYRHEVVVGYNNVLEKIVGMPPILAQAIDSLERFGGELWADYGNTDLTLVKTFK